jgi:hypothetical protein
MSGTLSSAVPAAVSATDLLNHSVGQSCRRLTNKVVNRMQFAARRFAEASPLYCETSLHKPYRLQRRYVYYHRP